MEQLVDNGTESMLVKHEQENLKTIEMTFLEEMQDLFAFLHSLGGILAGVTIFFPLSAAFFKLISAEYRWHTDDYMRGFGYFKPTLVVAITTITIIFGMFWLVSHRAQFKPRQRKVMQRRALRCFVLGIFSLVFYVTAYELVSDVTYTQGIYGGNPANSCRENTYFSRRCSMSENFILTRRHIVADRLAHLGLMIIIFVTLINLPLSLLTALTGSSQLENFGNGGGWAIPALAFLIALLLGLPSLVLGFIDLRQQRWQQVGRMLAFWGPLIIGVSFIYTSHALDPCFRELWTIQSKLETIPLCSYSLREVLIHDRFHWLLHALPDVVLVPAYWFALKVWHKDIAFLHVRKTVG